MHGVARQQGLELVHAGEAFARGDGDVDVPRHLCHRVETIRAQRVLEEHRRVFLDAAAERDRFGRRQAAVDLDAEIDFSPDRLAQAADIVDGLFDLCGVGFVVGGRFAFVEQGIEMAKRGEAGLLESHRFGQQRVDGAAFHVAVEPRLVAHTAAEQFIDRNAERLALDVPQRDVQRRHRAGDRGAGEVVGAQHDIPVMLYGEGVLANEVFAVFDDRRGRGFELTPGAGLAQPDDAGVGVDADIEEAIERKRFDLGNLHGASPSGWETVGRVGSLGNPEYWVGRAATLTIATRCTLRARCAAARCR